MILFIQLRNKSNLKFTCHNLKRIHENENIKREKSRTRNTDEMCWMPVGAMCLVPPSSLSFFYILTIFFYFIYTMKHFKSRYMSSITFCIRALY